jgi:murein L,D-transpeptidase YcbB/YkuD
MDTLAYFHLASAYETPIAENAFDRNNTESSETPTTKKHSSVFWMRFLSVAVILGTLSAASSALASYHHGCKAYYHCYPKHHVVKVKHHYPKKCRVAKVKHHHYKHHVGVGKGTSGAKVAKIQRKLRHLGYFDGKVTGYFGPVTKYAVIAFQEDYGIKPTGFVGPVTKRALGL